MLPPEAFEMIGKAVAQQFQMYDAKFDAMLARSELKFSGLCSEVSGKLASIKDGEPGKDGINGVDGVNGKDGANGIDGKDGLNGSDGKDGADGLNGKDGVDGANGMDGKDGAHGEKGEAGEKGETGEKGEQGIVSAEALADAYKGIWSEGTEYLRGQTVTWGGSHWLCLKDGADKPGDGSESWRLIVKRGRDGKDGKNGEKGEKGSPGTKGDKGEIGYA